MSDTVVVPMEPTPEMLAAVSGLTISVRVSEDDYDDYPVSADECEEIYRAMVAAAPSPAEGEREPFTHAIKCPQFNRPCNCERPATHSPSALRADSLRLEAPTGMPDRAWTEGEKDGVRRAVETINAREDALRVAQEAVAWQYRSCAGFGLASGGWSEWKTVTGVDERTAREKAKHRPDLYEVRVLTLAPAALSAQGVDEAMVDIGTHREAWRNAILNCAAIAADQENRDDESYWTHELRAFDRTFAALAAAVGGQSQDAALEKVAIRLYNAFQGDRHNLHTLAWSELSERTRNTWRNQAMSATGGPQ